MGLEAKVFIYPVLANDCHNPEDGRFCSDGRALVEIGVDLRGLSRDFRERIPGLQRMVELISKVHGVPAGYPDAKVEIWSDLKGAHGSYEQGGKVIKLAENSGFNASSLVHEFGHHISLSEFGEGKLDFLNKVKKDQELNAWLEAVRSTPQHAVLFEREGGGDAHASYLRDSRELFARSYAQWITERSGSAVLKAEHNKIRGLTDGIYQWSDSEFLPIGRALDAYFEKKGWKR